MMDQDLSRAGMNDTRNIAEATFTELQKLLWRHRIWAAPVQMADPGDGLKMDENLSTAIRRYTSLCEALPLRFLTFDHNLPKCNGVQTWRYEDIWCTSGIPLSKIIISYTTTKAIGWRAKPSGISRRRSNNYETGEMTVTEPKTTLPQSITVPEVLGWCTAEDTHQ